MQRIFSNGLHAIYLEYLLRNGCLKCYVTSGLNASYATYVWNVSYVVYI